LRSPKLDRAKQAYTDEARRLAAQSMAQLEDAKVTPDALTISGVALCIAGSVAVWFEYTGWGFYWRAEALGLEGAVGLGSRAERVVVITAGLVLAPLSDLVLPISMALLATTAWVTVVQRILFVRKQLRRLR
jgi:branched-subunit amino acid ABC-type transport system permease component